jgi:hypothetical protein
VTSLCLSRACLVKDSDAFQHQMASQKGAVSLPGFANCVVWASDQVGLVIS